MRSPGHPKAARWTGRAAALLALAASASGASAAQPTGQGLLAAHAGDQRPAARGHETRRLEARVEVLSRLLDLDARQQAGLKQILQHARARLMEARSDSSVQPAHRAIAARAIGDETADRIRALLNDEQKRKYGSPRQAREAAGQGPRVEDWLHRGELR